MPRIQSRQIIKCLLVPVLCTQLRAQVDPDPDPDPLGVFDFAFHGKTPAEKIQSIDGMGFDGIAMFFNGNSDIKRLDGYLSAKPNLKLIAGLFVTDHKGRLNIKQTETVIAKLSDLDATLWLIMKGSKKDEASIIKRIREIADLAAKRKVPVCLYPHDGEVHTYTDAEEALHYLKKANRPNLSLSLHLCHELRAGNGKRIGDVIANIKPHLKLVSISGANHAVTPNNPDWRDTIKPLSKGDFDASIFVRELRKANYQGPVILHTFGLHKLPVAHHRESFEIYRKMHADIGK